MVETIEGLVVLDGFSRAWRGGGSLALKEYIFRVCFFFDHPLINKVLNSKAFEDSL